MVSDDGDDDDVLRVLLPSLCPCVSVRDAWAVFGLLGIQ